MDTVTFYRSLLQALTVKIWMKRKAPDRIREVDAAWESGLTFGKWDWFNRLHGEIHANKKNQERLEDRKRKRVLEDQEGGGPTAESRESCPACTTKERVIAVLLAENKELRRKLHANREEEEGSGGRPLG